MKIIQIRDVPDSLYRQLKEIAEVERRSLSQQAIVMLAKGLQAEPTPKQRRIEVIDGIKRKAKKPNLMLTDPTTLVRRDRSR
jgi:plasmid stability protein